MALNRIIIVKNVSGEAFNLCDQYFPINGSYTLVNDLDYERFSTESEVIVRLHSKPPTIKISDGEQTFDDPFAGERWLIGTTIETTQKNEHELRTAGLGKSYIDSSQFIGSITLSNKSGLTYEYVSDKEIAKEDMVVCSEWCNRAFVESVSGVSIGESVSGTMTLSLELEEGAYVLSKHAHVDYVLPAPPDGSSYWYLWGAMIDAENFGKNDIVLMEVVADFSAIGLGELELKKYDECWVRHLVKLGKLITPDGAPGQIPWVIIEEEYPFPVILRIDYYPSDITKTTVDFWYDYMLTTREAV